MRGMIACAGSLVGIVAVSQPMLGSNEGMPALYLRQSCMRGKGGSNVAACADAKSRRIVFGHQCISTVFQYFGGA
jgi:hypothetical protein